LLLPLATILLGGIIVCVRNPMFTAGRGRGKEG